MHDPAWPIPGSSNGSTADVIIAGSGNNWGMVIRYALTKNRVCVSGVDQTVGLGGFIQGGGHGPLSSTYGLSADQILQATVVTTTGEVLVANALQNQDLYWAIRGGGGGQYGVVTEYVMMSYPAPENFASSSLTMTGLSGNQTNSSTAVDGARSWDAFVELMARFPDLMDAGIVGTGMDASGDSSYLTVPTGGVAASMSFWSFNSSTEDLDATLQSLREALVASSGNSSAFTVAVTKATVVPTFSEFFEAMNSGESASGGSGLQSSRLLGRTELTDTAPSEIRSYLQRLAQPQVAKSSLFIIGLQGDPGPRQVPVERRGAVNPTWRDAYVHLISSGADVDLETNTPGRALRKAADWAEVNQEQVYREWAPEKGSYMNEANPYTTEW